MTGTAGTLFAALNYVRERPYLLVGGEEYGNEIRLRVFNDGRRPTTVLAAGWVDFAPSRTLRAGAIHMRKLPSAGIVLVSPGEAKQWTVTHEQVYERMQQAYGSRVHSWPCVLDAHGRVRAATESVSFGQNPPD